MRECKCKSIPRGPPDCLTTCTDSQERPDVSQTAAAESRGRRFTQGFPVRLPRKTRGAVDAFTLSSCRLPRESQALSTANQRSSLRGVSRRFTASSRFGLRRLGNRHSNEICLGLPMQSDAPVCRGSIGEVGEFREPAKLAITLR